MSMHAPCWLRYSFQCFGHNHPPLPETSFCESELYLNLFISSFHFRYLIVEIPLLIYLWPNKLPKMRNYTAPAWGEILSLVAPKICTGASYIGISQVLAILIEYILLSTFLLYHLFLFYSCLLGNLIKAHDFYCCTCKLNTF